MIDSLLFAQFRNQYSSGSLTTELLMLNENQYVVRATVTIDEHVIVTAMAADAHLETAEERAQARVLTLLGIEAPNTASSAGEDKLPPQPDKPLIETTPALPGDTLMVDETLDIPLDEIPDIAVSTAEPHEAAAATEQPAPSLAATTMEALNISTSPVDLSDIIAQTDVEMVRLGWTSRRGREYLEQAYGKRSRQQLTDEELLAFLLYLESQPTPIVG